MHPHFFFHVFSTKSTFGELQEYGHFHLILITLDITISEVL